MRIKNQTKRTWMWVGFILAAIAFLEALWNPHLQALFIIIFAMLTLISIWLMNGAYEDEVKEEEATEELNHSP